MAETKKIRSEADIIAFDRKAGDAARASAKQGRLSSPSSSPRMEPSHH